MSLQYLPSAGHPSRVLAPLLLALLPVAACGGGASGDPGPQPPPGTGQVVIEMNGLWAVTDLERVNSPEPVPTASHPMLPFVPLFEGALLTVEFDRLLDPAGDPLFQTWYPAVPNQRYLNRADGRFLLFDWLNQGSHGGCSWHEQIRAAFGSVDADEMWGEVVVRTMSSCPGPAVITSDPNGHFRLRLVRVYAGSPARGDPEPSADGAVGRDVR